MSGLVQISTTTDDKDEADKLAILLVEQRLAACVQVIGPVRSTYWWEGGIEQAEEWLLIVKSKEALYERVEKAIKENHSYEIPEVLSVRVAEGSPDYLAWLERNLDR